MLKVIGAGFGRTGTMSIKAALEALGFAPCYHMFEVSARPEDAAVWESAAKGEQVDFAALLDGWQATVDWPACSFYRELMEVYPAAKVLLTVRDPDKWYDSCRNTIYPSSTGKPVGPPEKWLARGPDDAGAAARRSMIKRLIWQRTFDDRFEDRAYAIDVFNHHVDAVKSYVPPGRLLVYDVKQGWAPLCEFLGVPAPMDTPFPHVNDTASFIERAQGQPQESSR